MAFAASDLKTLRRRRRHVPYLTQGELAELVGVSTVVISQIEQGKYPNLSAATLHRIFRELALNRQDEMFALGLLSPRTFPQRQLESAPKWIGESIEDTGHPVVVVNPGYDLVAWNSQMELMMDSYAAGFMASGNAMIAVFDMPQMKTFFADWDEYSRTIVSGMRMGYGVHPDFRELVSDRAEEMARRNDYFRMLWKSDDPLVMPTLEKDIQHPSLGHLRMIQLITQIVEVPYLTKVEFLPANDETRVKLAKL